MALRKIIVGARAAGTLTLGVTGIGVAGAEEAPNPDRRDMLCERGEHGLERLEQVSARLDEILVKLADARAKAVEAGRDQLVARIDKAIERATAAQARLAQRVEMLSARLAEHCTADAAG